VTLSQQSGDINSAHPLVEVNILTKIEENPSTVIGFIEQTRWSRWID
jgi:hypothetical protein